MSEINTPNETIQEDTVPNEVSDTVLSEQSGDENASHLGPILGVLIVVLVLILAGLYLWGRSLVNGPALEANVIPRSIENVEPETPRANADVQILQTYSSSDELNAIESDLESTNLDTLDTELIEIEQELNTTG